MTTDEAREALLLRWMTGGDYETPRHVMESLLDAFEAAIRAEWLDEERLAKALHADRLTTGQCVNTSKTAWRVHLSEAEHIATWYARLAEAER